MSSSTVENTSTRGDVDIAAVGSLLADSSRARLLMALDDGRALPAGRLAAEAGVTPATTSGHLAKLVDGGLLVVEVHGRHRYYRLASAAVGHLLEVLAQFAPARPVRSLRQHTRGSALREARTCYDHFAGRFGVALMTALLDHGFLVGGDGLREPGDGPVGYGTAVDYRLTPDGRAFLDHLGVTVPPRRALTRYCVDWSEQRHHLAGAVGRGLHDRLFELDWVRRTPGTRAVRVTADGRRGLRRALGVEWS